MAKEIVNKFLTGIGLGKFVRGSTVCNKTKEFAQKNECINKPIENNTFTQVKNCLYGLIFKKCEPVKPPSNNCVPKPKPPVKQCKSKPDLLSKVKNLSCPANKKDILSSVKKKMAVCEPKNADCSDKTQTCGPCPKKPAKKVEKVEQCPPKAVECDPCPKKAEKCVPCPPPSVDECDPCSKKFEPYDPSARNVRCPPRPRPPQPSHCIEQIPTNTTECSGPCPRRTEDNSKC